MATQTALPRWRGFNLLGMFSLGSHSGWREDDFRWIAEWGFDFVRLPLCYLLWVADDDPLRIDESKLAEVDRAVDLGSRHGLHVSLNLHRAPGYSVNREREEPFDLWRDERALEAFGLHWETFARRYRGIASDRLSFDLVNEPPAAASEGSPGMTRADHERVMRATVAGIRGVDPERLVVLDGLSWGNDPLPELADLDRVAQSCRAYSPAIVSHYRAAWMQGSDTWAEPAWPGPDPSGERWDRARLERHYAPWVDLAQRGVGVHCGEGGAYSATPHAVVLAWLRDVLEILTEHGIGYALWNFRGPFGVLDNGRADAPTEDFRGHALDRELLALLREF